MSSLIHFRMSQQNIGLMVWPSRKNSVWIIASVLPGFLHSGWWWALPLGQLFYFEVRVINTFVTRYNIGNKIRGISDLSLNIHAVVQQIFFPSSVRRCGLNYTTMCVILISSGKMCRPVPYVQSHSVANIVDLLSEVFEDSLNAFSTLSSVIAGQRSSKKVTIVNWKISHF